ncbi:MAG: endopeptidase La [Firmicutes bacterium]|nr:endopeptidase La [Candidatus Fiminaster equi]
MAKMTLPLLITKSFVIFPEQKNIQVDAGRDFSIKAIDASRDLNSSLLLVVAQKDPSIEVPTQKDICEVGTLCRITSYSNMKNYIRVHITGTKRVKINNLSFDATGYFVADATSIEDKVKDETHVIAYCKNIIQALVNTPQVSGVVPRTLMNEITTKGVEPVMLPDLLAPYIPLTDEGRMRILNELDLEKRLELTLMAIDEVKKEAEVDKDISKDVQEQTEKQQRDYILREKLRAIKKELGDDPDGSTDEETIKKRLEEHPYPDHVKAKVKSELKRFSMMPQASLESSLIMSYIQTLMDVPWFEETQDNDDLENVKKILDEDHYGLTDVKKRIVEYLAVKKMTGNLKAPILCFYGPPGCGKTSLGKSIARALGRKFFKASLGGISDEAEIRGHRRTYVGSMPGRIISGMKRVGVTNPVFLLDEVDKLASSYKGDPASALLEVLDPEQNFAFNDNYLEEPYDLSNVLFICTANYLENIPAPLRDRLELIEVNSYTEIEKVKIAKGFLFKKQIAANGLKARQISFSEDAYTRIIRGYTREAGVRELERKIASVMRKAVVELLTNKEVKKISVTPELVEKYLGAPIFEDSKKEEKGQVGVVTGLAYTEYGGDILPIEVNYFPGKGSLILTGKLGDVMKESATIAYSYVRSNASKYKIDPKLFEKNDIHIHVPEGAVPKDGPSAGVAITTAIISSYTKSPVSDEVAMTGEVTLRGHALPIGGLREKSLAALRSGIKTIIVPAENKKAVNELPKEVKDNLKIVYMKNVDDALKVAFVK